MLELCIGYATLGNRIRLDHKVLKLGKLLQHSDKLASQLLQLSSSLYLEEPTYERDVLEVVVRC